MPNNKKEGIVFGICMCCIMAFFMGLLNISIHMGGLNTHSLLVTLKAFPITVIIVFLLESFVVQSINLSLLQKFCQESDSDNAKILFNCFFIVTMMTIIGELLGGDSITIVIKEFFIRWPRNYFAAFFLNILIAGPISRMVLTKVRANNDKNSISQS